MRIQLGKVEQHRGMWRVELEVYSGNPGSEQLINIIDTGAIFDTEEDAYGMINEIMDQQLRRANPYKEAT